MSGRHGGSPIAARLISPTGTSPPGWYSTRPQYDRPVPGAARERTRRVIRAGAGDLPARGGRPIPRFAAIDGIKLRCQASLRANRKLASIEAELAALTEEIETELARIVAEILTESARADLEDDRLPDMPDGPGRPPGTLPDLPGCCHGRCTARPPARARLARAKQVLDDDWAERRADYDAVLRERGERIRATGKGIPGPKPKPPVRDPDTKINVTDPDCRIMKDAHNTYFAGYNAQNTVSGDWMALVSAVVNDENDTAQLHPMMNATTHNLTAAGSPHGIGVFTGDSRYRTQAAVAALDPDGPIVLLATGKEHETRHHALLGQNGQSDRMQTVSTGYKFQPTAKSRFCRAPRKRRACGTFTWGANVAGRRLGVGVPPAGFANSS